MKQSDYYYFPEKTDTFLRKQTERNKCNKRNVKLSTQFATPCFLPRKSPFFSHCSPILSYQYANFRYYKITNFGGCIVGGSIIFIYICACAPLRLKNLLRLLRLLRYAASPNCAACYATLLCSCCFAAAALHKICLLLRKSITALLVTLCIL